MWPEALWLKVMLFSFVEFIVCELRLLGLLDVQFSWFGCSEKMKAKFALLKVLLVYKCNSGNIS